MSRPKKSYAPEFREEAVKLVIETSRPIAQVAKELGVQEGTLGSSVARYRREHVSDEPELTVTERARLRQLERETREFRMENEFLKKAALDSDDQRNTAGGWVDHGSNGSAGDAGRDERRLVATMAGR